MWPPPGTAHQAAAPEPTLTMVVARDPSLLSNRSTWPATTPNSRIPRRSSRGRAQPRLLSLLPSETRRRGRTKPWSAPPGRRCTAAPRSTGWDELAGDLPPPRLRRYLLAFFWLVRLFVDNRRWSRIFKLQSDVHGRSSSKFTTNQELAAYMETEAGRRFLEAAPIPVDFGTSSAYLMPSPAFSPRSRPASSWSCWESASSCSATPDRR